MGVIEARRRILLSAPHPVTTAPAPVASFETDMVGKLRSAKFSFLPVQDLHGYDLPWPAGGGKNKFALPDGTIVKNGMTLKWQNGVFTIYAPNATSGEVGAGDSAWKGFGYCTLPAGSYTFYTARPTVSGSLSTYLINYDTGDRIVSDKNTGTFTFTLASETKVYLGFYMLGAQCTPESEWKVGVFLTSEYTGYSPYSNVCPITGWTGANVSRTGKNLFDKSTLSNVSNYADKLGGYYYTKPIKLQPNTDYCIVPSSTSTLSTSTYYVLYINPSLNDPDYLESINSQFMYPVRAGLPAFVRFTTGPTGTIRLGAPSSGTDQALETFMSIDWQIELGSTATPYATYTGSTYPISWQSAGTVYGGYVDLVRGEVVATWGIVDMGDLTWIYRDANSIFVSNTIKTAPLGKFDIMCSAYKVSKNPFNNMINLTISSWPDLNNRILKVKDTDYTDEDLFKAAVTGQKVAYQLATPIAYPLTPQIIKSLRGANNMWSNANGDTQVTYWTH